MKAKQRVPAPRGRKLDDLAANEVGCSRISLRCASPRRSIAPTRPGTRGMSWMRAERKVMERGRFCFVAWCFAATVWLLTGPGNARPFTLVGDVAPGSQASATYLGVDTTT